jgi:hypothetical protein
MDIYRSEAFISDYQARDHMTTAEMAMDENGFILGVRVKTLCGCWCYISTVGAASSYDRLYSSFIWPLQDSRSVCRG